MFSKLKYLILGALLAGAFFYNPPVEMYYNQVLEDEAGMGGGLFSEIKHTVVAETHTYENFYLLGTLKSKRTDELKYVGFVNMVIKL